MKTPDWLNRYPGPIAVQEFGHRSSLILVLLIFELAVGVALGLLFGLSD